MIRTSTGSIRVMKIIQNRAIRRGNWKNATANADSREMAILPVAMVRAMIRLLRIIRRTGGAWTRSPVPVRHARP